MVFVAASVFRNPSSLAGGMPTGLRPLASHAKITLASAVFLQTRMNTGAPGRPPSMAMGWWAHLRMASGLGLARLPPRSQDQAVHPAVAVLVGPLHLVGDLRPRRQTGSGCP